MEGSSSGHGGGGFRAGGAGVADVAPGRSLASRGAHSVLLAGSGVLLGSGMGAARDVRRGQPAVRRPWFDTTNARVRGAIRRTTRFSGTWEEMSDFRKYA
jgi:hypothetical protein